MGPDPIAQLAKNLMRFNQGGIQGAIGWNAAQEQKAIDSLPEFQAQVSKTSIKIADYADKNNIARPGLQHVLASSYSAVGANTAPKDLDQLVTTDEWRNELAAQKDNPDFAAAMEKFGWDQRLARKDEKSESGTQNFQVAYDASYLKHLKRVLAKPTEEWAQRKENNVRIARISDTRSQIGDSLAMYTGADFTQDEDGVPIPEGQREAHQRSVLHKSFKSLTASYAANYADWPINLRAGINYDADIFRNAWVPVVEAAARDINIDPDLLQDWVTAYQKLRRPTYAMLVDDKGEQTGERSKVPTGSSSVVGGFREEAGQMLETIYDEITTRRGKLTQQSFNDQKFVQDNILWPMMDNFQNDTWAPEQKKLLAEAGIRTLQDVSHKNYNDFINIATTVPEFKELLESPELERMGQENQLATFSKVKQLLEVAYVARQKSGSDMEQVLDQTLRQEIMQDSDLRRMMVQFKPIFRALVSNNRNPRDAFAAFITEKHLPALYRASNPGHTIANEKFMGAVKGWMEGHFMSGAGNYGVQHGRETLNRIMEAYQSTGKFPKGAIEELRSIRMQQYGEANTAGDTDLDGDITKVVELANRHHAGASLMHDSIGAEKDIILDVFGSAAGYGMTSTPSAGNEPELGFPFFTEIIAPNSKHLLKLTDDPSDRINGGNSYVENLSESIPLKKAATASYNFLLRQITTKKTAVIDNWLDEKRGESIVDPKELAAAWSAGGRADVIQELRQHFKSLPFLKELETFHKGQKPDTLGVNGGELNGSMSYGAGIPNVEDGDSRNKAQESANELGRTTQMASAGAFMTGVANVGALSSKPEDANGSHPNVAVQMYAGQHGDNMAATGRRVREAAAIANTAIDADLITTAKKVAKWTATPLDNPDELIAGRAKLAGLKNYARDFKMKHQGLSWEDIQDGTASFMVEEEEGGFSMEIKVNRSHIDTSKHQIFPTWWDINDATALYDEYELHPEDMSPERLERFEKLVTFLRTSRMNIDLMPMENGELHIETQNNNVLRYQTEVAEPQRKIKLGLDVGDLPADTNVSIKRKIMENFYKSPTWPKGRNLPAPTGGNYMFKGKEYTPEQAGHIKNAETNNKDIATRGWNVKEGVNLPQFWQLYSGLSGDQITQEQPLATHHKWRDKLGISTNKDHRSKTGKAVLDYKGKSHEELAGNTSWKQAVATELTLAALGIANPLGEAYKINPWYSEEQAGVGHYEPKAGDPRNRTLWTKRRKQKGAPLDRAGGKMEVDLYAPSGSDRTEMFHFLGIPYKRSISDFESNTYRSKNWDDTYHKYYQLLSGGTMKMDKDHLPRSEAYATQTPVPFTTNSSLPNPELAEAFNMLVRASVRSLDNPFEETEEYAPYLKDFKVFPLPLPPSPWDYDTDLPEMDTISRSKKPVNLSPRGGVKPKEKKQEK